MTAKTTRLNMDTRLDLIGAWDSLRLMLGNALIVTRREVRDSFRDWRILVPIFILTFLFPFLAQYVAVEFREYVQQYGATVIQERLIPFMLMIVGFFPISISLVIALETFVGEKERRSLEPLLSTPLTNTELYIGKTLAAMVPPLLSSIGGMMVYLGSLLFGSLAWRPEPMLIFQIILLTTVQALVMVTGAVVVSSQATSTRAANLLASFIVIPMALLIQGESAIMFMAPDADSPRGIGALWAIIIGMFLVAVLLLRVGNSIFNREDLLSSTIDQINLRGSLGKLWRYIRAIDEQGTPARNVFDWYRRAIPYSLGRIKIAFWITLVVFSLAVAAGYYIGTLPQWQLPLESISQQEFVETSEVELFGVDFKNTSTVRFIFLQNLRVLMGVMLLSVFSFGIGALLIPPITFLAAGYLFSQVLRAGYGPEILMAGILPHGIIEIPVILIMAAASLALGAVVTKPPRGTTVGHAWITRIGDTIKLLLGIVLPGLIIAALIEVYVTPELILRVLN
jgi:uncharacterized membrane protein SpoIIM required for sporulation/ABC-type transport system involved in multi-copper enzyme maturation permease subunit